MMKILNFLWNMMGSRWSCFELLLENRLKGAEVRRRSVMSLSQVSRWKMMAETEPWWGEARRAPGVLSWRRPLFLASCSWGYNPGSAHLLACWPWWLGWEQFCVGSERSRQNWHLFWRKKAQNLLKKAQNLLMERKRGRECEATFLVFTLNPAIPSMACAAHPAPLPSLPQHGGVLKIRDFS